MVPLKSCNLTTDVGISQPLFVFFYHFLSFYAFKTCFWDFAIQSSFQDFWWELTLESDLYF